MSKGEPIKLSTTHFVFCAQSYRGWLGKVNAWGWEEYGSQIRIWEATHFWENAFLTSWESKFLEMHAQAIIHPYLSFLTHSHPRWALSRS